MKFDMFYVGQTFRTKSLLVSKEDIIKFAESFDPEYMHLDEEKANKGMFHGIIASGIHTIAVSFKLWVEEGFFGDDVIAGKSMDNIRFLRPVYPGDVLFVVAEVVKMETRSDEKGELTLLLSTYNDKNEKVLAGDLTVLIKR